MFGLEYLLAFMKIAFRVAYALVEGLVIWICWSVVVPNYLINFIHVPENMLYIPYWHIVAILLFLGFAADQIQKFVPKFVEVTQTNNANSTAKTK